MKAIERLLAAARAEIGYIDYELIGDDEEMDAAAFKKYMAEYRQKLRDNDCSGYSTQARQ